MDIQTTITDEQAAALAQLHRVRDYADGNDLIAQVAADAEFQAKKRGLIGAVAAQADVSPVDAAIAAFNTLAATPITMPPIKIKPSITPIKVG